MGGKRLRYKVEPTPTHLSREELERRCLAVIERRPGITSTDLAGAVGLPRLVNPTNHACRLSEFTANFFENLKESGAIEVLPPTNIYDRERFYLPGMAPKQKPLFKPAPGLDRLACKAWVDPSIKGSWQPPSTAAPERGDEDVIEETGDDIANDRARTGMKTQPELERLIYSILGMSSLPSKAYLCKQAGVPTNSLSPSINQRLSSLYEEVCNQWKTKSSKEEEPIMMEPVEPSQVAVTKPNQSIVELIEQIRQENESLKKQLSQQPESSAFKPTQLIGPIESKLHEKRKELSRLENDRTLRLEELKVIAVQIENASNQVKLLEDLIEQYQGLESSISKTLAAA